MSEDCRTCKKEDALWKDCTREHDWFSPSDIWFCWYACMWLIQSRDYLEEDLWPPEPKGSMRIRTPIQANAYFRTPREFKAELDIRLKSVTRDAREALIDEINRGLSREQLCGPAKKALGYVCGWRRKRTPFAQWRASRSYYKSITKVAK